MSAKIGLLLTKSVLYPSMAFDIAGGLRGGLAEGGMAETEIKTESIGIAGDDKLIYAACEKLLFDGAGIVAGYINPASAEKLQPLFAGANAALLALDAGYHFPNKVEQLPNVFYLSLQGALCMRSAVTRAGHDGSKGMAYVGSFYDAGYRMPYVSYRGLEDAGGHITYNHITALKRADFTLEPLMAHLRQAPGDAVIAAFCGDMLQDFFGACAEWHVLDGHAVYGAPFASDEVWLAKSRYPGVDVQVCVPWATTLHTEQNEHFMAALKEKRTSINFFSLLGWEAGLAAAAALRRGDYAALEGYSYTGPRGTVTLDAATHQCMAPVYDATVVKDEATGNCRLEVNGVNAYAEGQRAPLEADINALGGAGTSWHNAYGCLEN